MNSVHMKGIFFNLFCMFTRLKLYESLSPPNPLLISFLYKLLVQCSTSMIKIVELSLLSVSDHLWLTLHIISINQLFCIKIKQCMSCPNCGSHFILQHQLYHLIMELIHIKIPAYGESIYLR